MSNLLNAVRLHAFHISCLLIFYVDPGLFTHGGIGAICFALNAANCTVGLSQCWTSHHNVCEAWKHLILLQSFILFFTMSRQSVLCQVLKYIYFLVQYLVSEALGILNPALKLLTCRMFSMIQLCNALLLIGCLSNLTLIRSALW